MGKDSELTPSNIEKVRFDYSPLGIYAKNLTRLESVEKSNKQLANFIDARNNDNNDDDNDDNNDDDDDNNDNDDNNDSPDDDNKTLKISNTQSPYYYKNIIRFTPFIKNESINKFKKYSLKTQYNEINKLNKLKDIKAKNNVQDFLKRVVLLNTEKIYKEKYFKPYLENYDKNYDKL